MLDLGGQPACDYFPPSSDPGPDPVYPLQMWLCAGCGLAQLAADPTVPQEPRATEPAALIAQAADAVNRVAAAGLLPAGARVAEYGSPHGGSWLELLRQRGLITVDAATADPATGDPATAETAAAGGVAPAVGGVGGVGVGVGSGESVDVIVDCFGLMHEADQAGALARRLARLSGGGVLLLQYHSLDAIIRLGQWNALRHGHYAYYSTTALAAMLAAQGFEPFAAWKFDLYGGTVLLAARRSQVGLGAAPVKVGRVAELGAEPGGGALGGAECGAGPGGAAAERGAASPMRIEREGQALAEAQGLVAQLLAEDAKVGVCDPDVLLGLQDDARATAAGLRDWLLAEQAAGPERAGLRRRLPRGRLLCDAKIDRSLLPAIVDASPAKQGLRMPGTTFRLSVPDRLTRRHRTRCCCSSPTSGPRSAPRSRSRGRRWPLDRRGLPSPPPSLIHRTQPGSPAAGLFQALVAPARAAAEPQLSCG